MKLPLGYTWEVGGQYDSQRKAFRDLLLVAGIATALVFVILVIQFRAFTQAAIILAAAPLSLGGAFALLIATHTDLNVSSAMGLILLVGLVVKNGILLDFAESVFTRECHGIRRSGGRTRSTPADPLDTVSIGLLPSLAWARCP
jgi:multidrug efflux pump subunit AcrB